jgi:hypothetical protein
MANAMYLDRRLRVPASQRSQYFPANAVLPKESGFFVGRRQLHHHCVRTQKTPLDPPQRDRHLSATLTREDKDRIDQRAKRLRRHPRQRRIR